MVERGYFLVFTGRSKLVNFLDSNCYRLGSCGVIFTRVMWIFFIFWLVIATDQGHVETREPELKRDARSWTQTIRKTSKTLSKTFGKVVFSSTIYVYMYEFKIRVSQFIIVTIVSIKFSLFIYFLTRCFIFPLTLTPNHSPNAPLRPLQNHPTGRWRNKEV